MSETTSAVSDFAAVLATIVGIALALALLIATPIALVTIGHAHHESACVTLSDKSQRLACLSGGTDEAHAIAQCGNLIGGGTNSPDTAAFNKCMEIAVGRNP